MTWLLALVGLILMRVSWRAGLRQVRVYRVRRELRGITRQRLAAIHGDAYREHRRRR